MPAERIGYLAAREGLEIHGLTPQSATLEEAFMDLTRGSLEYGTPADGTHHRAKEIKA